MKTIKAISLIAIFLLGVNSHGSENREYNIKERISAFIANDILNITYPEQKKFQDKLIKEKHKMDLYQLIWRSSSMPLEDGADMNAALARNAKEHNTDIRNIRLTKEPTLIGMTYDTYLTSYTMDVSISNTVYFEKAGNTPETNEVLLPVYQDVEVLHKVQCDTFIKLSAFKISESQGLKSCKVIFTQYLPGKVIYDTEEI